MKPLTVQLPDEVYERAYQRAVERGTTLTGEVTEWIKRFSEGKGNGSGKESCNRLDKIVEELDSVAEECRSANWDNRGAEAVSPQTLDHARRLLAALPKGEALPSVGVEPDGHLTLEWYRNPTWTLSVSVSPEGELYYAALFETNDVRGREAFSTEVPEIVLNLIRRVGAA